MEETDVYVSFLPFHRFLPFYSINSVLEGVYTQGSHLNIGFGIWVTVTALSAAYNSYNSPTYQSFWTFGRKYKKFCPLILSMEIFVAGTWLLWDWLSFGGTQWCDGAGLFWLLRTRSAHSSQVHIRWCHVGIYFWLDGSIYTPEIGKCYELWIFSRDPAVKHMPAYHYIYR